MNVSKIVDLFFQKTYWTFFSFTVLNIFPEPLLSLRSFVSLPFFEPLKQIKYSYDQPEINTYALSDLLHLPLHSSFYHQNCHLHHHYHQIIFIDLFLNIMFVPQLLPHQISFFFLLTPFLLCLLDCLFPTKWISTCTGTPPPTSASPAPAAPPWSCRCPPCPPLYQVLPDNKEMKWTSDEPQYRLSGIST